MTALFVCSTCQRTFDEGGYCPFDRTQLREMTGSERQTLLSRGMSAQIPVSPTGSPTLEQRRETFPLTPSSASQSMPSASSSMESTNVRRVISASSSEADALELMRRGQQEDEYAKLVGTTLDGRYFVEQKLGEGGMGVVFAARHAVIERPLAIKVLKREVMRDTGTIQRFVREAKAASRIGHPNIVDVTDFGTTPDGMTYSVMEFVQGDTLGLTIRREAPFKPERVIKIAAQIARALGAAHDKGVVHRDLKPENVFLAVREGRVDFVKIVDFGIAKVLSTPAAPTNPLEPRLTRAGSVFGTPEYMAPEQAAGRNDTDGRVDIYALGVIMYEMLTGRVPLRGDTTVRTLAMVMLDQPEPPSKVRPDLPIPPELEATIMQALAKKREQRFQTMGELITSLDRVLPLVGQSITGSPVYALSPFPPGADPSIVGSLTPPVIPHGAQPSGHGPPRRNRPTTKRHEPQFTHSDKPRTFEHLWTETELPRPKSRWPIVIIFGLLAMGAVATAVALVIVKKTDGPTRRDAAVPIAMTTPDAAVVVPVEIDAAPVIDAAIDAPEEAPLDANKTPEIIVTDPHRDAGPHIVHVPKQHDAGPTIVATPNGRGTYGIQVVTKPEGATLFVGGSYHGPGGTTIEYPAGTRIDVTCHMLGYTDGVAHLVFDGTSEIAVCPLTRIKRCLDNIHNPFDDCPSN
ncbi:MAG TPA: serine/threonine-protein kinase [Kofleriaceae bacterium]